MNISMTPPLALLSAYLLGFGIGGVLSHARPCPKPMIWVAGLGGILLGVVAFIGS